MLHASPLSVPPEPAETTDYALVRRAIAFLSNSSREQPSLDLLAEAMGLSPTAVQKLFTRWAGLSPKEFLQALTLDHAKRLLDASASVLEAAYESGLSGPGRLHDLFVTYEALSPGDYKARGAGLTIDYGWFPSPFGAMVVMATARGVCGLAFADEGQENSTLLDLQQRWPRAHFRHDRTHVAPYAAQIFPPDAATCPLRLHLVGTDFEIRVWDNLLKVPAGSATTYAALAKAMGRPGAARAVGRAVGHNPVAFVVPCHRVLGRAGTLTGYHWGLTRKRAILGWEFARGARASSAGTPGPATGRI